MKLPAVEMGDRIVGRGLEHAIELLAGQREAPGLRVERGVLANERPHRGLEVVRALDQVRSLGFLPVALPQQLLGGIETLLESYRVAEEERLQGTAGGRFVAQEPEQLQRLLGIVPGLNERGHS